MDKAEPFAEIDQALLAASSNEVSRRFIAAWLGWRGAARLLPKRADIDIADIKELLDRVILVELGGPDGLRVKVAGSRLRNHIDFEATGKNLAAITPPGDWPLRRWRITEMATRPCAGVSILRDRRRRDGITVEMVTLPLEPDAPGKPPLTLSNIAVCGGVYEPPPKDRPLLWPAVEEFRFLDLGAGVPEKAA
ncbi:MAG TPA: PAS domain-containing protein [Stellaceae bacterium]|nr:PAS domain-containing protein [Stellaceae bacterium]